MLKCMWSYTFRIETQGGRAITSGCSLASSTAFTCLGYLSTCLKNLPNGPQIEPPRFYMHHIIWLKTLVKGKVQPNQPIVGACCLAVFASMHGIKEGVNWGGFFFFLFSFFLMGRWILFSLIWDTGSNQV